MFALELCHLPMWCLLSPAQLYRAPRYERVATPPANAPVSRLDAFFESCAVGKDRHSLQLPGPLTFTQSRVLMQSLTLFIKPQGVCRTQALPLFASTHVGKCCVFFFLCSCFVLFLQTRHNRRLHFPELAKLGYKGRILGSRLKTSILVPALSLPCSGTLSKSFPVSESRSSQICLMEIVRSRC